MSLDSLDLIKTFHTVASEGSFSRSAAKLRLSKATVSKYVSQLEKRFGVRLLNRNTRSVSLTAAGSLLLERSAPMLEILRLTQAELSEHADRPTGRLRVSAPHGMSQGRLPKLLAEFLRYYPEVSISLYFSNRAIDMTKEAIDVALMLGPVPDVNLIVRRLKIVTMRVCASPDYWRRHGIPEAPSDLSQHIALTNSRLGPNPMWRFEDEGTALDVRINSRMDASENAPLIEAALQGIGVLYLPEFTIQPQLSDGALVAVLEPFARSDVWLSAAYLQRHHNSAALRAFVDFLVTRTDSN